MPGKATRSLKPLSGPLFSEPLWICLYFHDLVLFFCCRKAVASLNEPDQTGPCCTPIVCVLRVTRTEIKSHYSGDPCDMHKEHKARWSILRTVVFRVSSTYFYTGLASPLPFQVLLTEHQQQESDPLSCWSNSALWAYGMPIMTVNLALARLDALWSRYVLTAEKQWTTDFLSRLWRGMCSSDQFSACLSGASSFPFSFLRCYSARCCLWVLPSPWVGFANHREVPGATSWPQCYAQLASPHPR